MAENTNNTENNSANNEQSAEKKESNTPSVEEVLAQLEAEKAERAKLKASLDNALKEKGEITKQLRAKQTEEEAKAQEQAEADKKRDDEYNEMKSKYERMIASQAYASVVDTKFIDKLVDAIAEADHEAIAKIIANSNAKAVNDYKISELKGDTPPSHGSGKAMTKADIMAITDAEERQRAIAENLNLFK